MSAPDQSEFRGSNALWSLLDMLKDNAADFVDMGQRIAAAKMAFSLRRVKDEAGEFILDENGMRQLRSNLLEISVLAKRLQLPTSAKLIDRRLELSGTLPKKIEEFSLIVEVVQHELASKLFLFVPTERASYWEKGNLFSDEAKAAFPNASDELRGAGNAYAAALPEGSVFYSMRAVEHGLRALAADVGLTFDVQNWQNIINEIEAKIEGWRKNGIPGLTKAEKDERLQFLSEAAKEFAYFKDGWRNYAAHGKARYTEHQALTVLNHVADFIERLSDQLAEQP